MGRLTLTNMDNVNNLNGVSNFGHGDEAVIPREVETPAIDDTALSVDTEVSTKKPHKTKVRSAAQKALGGKY